MSGNPVAGAPATGAADPYAPPQATYNFSARLALTVSLVLLMITVVFIVIPLMVYLMITRSRRGGHGLAGGILRSISMISSRRHGLDASALSALPVTAYRQESGAAVRAECAVCLAELADGDEARELPNCGHLFHLECVDAWLRTRTTCPLCRAQAAGLPGEDGKAQTSSVAAAEPVLVGAAGGSLIVTVPASCTQKDARVSTSGSPCYK